MNSGLSCTESCTRLLSRGGGLSIKRWYSSQLGALAQLGEHLLCKQGVTGSIPVRSTSQEFLTVRLITPCALGVGWRGRAS